MKKLIAILLSCSLMIPVSVSASSNVTHSVQSGDTLWKIAVKYQVGCSELIKANPQIKNMDLIYPGQKVNIPVEDKSFEEEILKLVNEERAKEGLKPLTLNWELSRVAKYKSEDMRDNKYFSHNSPTYGTPFEMIKKFGISYSYAGENIAAGQKSASDVMKAWMNSSGHRANILNKNYTELGVGYASGGSYGTYWTQMFIKK